MFNVKSADLVSWMTPIEIEFDNWMTKTVISPWIFVDAVILDHGNFGWSWLAEVSRGIRMNFQETRWTSIPVDGDLEGSDHNDFCFILVKDGEILLNHHSPSSPRKVVHFKNLIKMSYCEHPALFGAFLGGLSPCMLWGTNNIPPSTGKTSRFCLISAMSQQWIHCWLGRWWGDIWMWRCLRSQYTFANMIVI